ncbi:MAG: hypothetical protein NC211_08930 [Alistipes senegalensis]|nr:hypothetical protein [Oxalobacter formigenes]MCM1281931.1 hypothetical protein [Alistipes senegalensis]
MRVDSSAISLFNGAYGQYGLHAAHNRQAEEAGGLLAETGKKAAGYRMQPEGAVFQTVAVQEKEVVYSQAVRAAAGRIPAGMAFSGTTDRGDQAGSIVSSALQDTGFNNEEEESGEAIPAQEGIFPGSQASRLPGSGKEEDAENDAAVSAEIAELKQREQEVIAHEAAHKAAGGQYAGAASYTYTTGPDNKKYIDGGEVSIHTPATNDPEEALKIAETIRRAALAPANPSSQDIAVAASASQEAAAARAEIARSEMTEKQDSGQAKNEKDADDTALTVSDRATANSLATSEGRRAESASLPEEGVAAVSLYGQRKAAAAYASQSVIPGSRASISAFHVAG